MESGDDLYAATGHAAGQLQEIQGVYATCQRKTVADVSARFDGIETQSDRPVARGAGDGDHEAFRNRCDVVRFAQPRGARGDRDRDE